MDLTRIRYFVEAANCGSFTEAAKRQFTSQPNVSKQLAALEADLGVKLFVRDGRNTRLTKAGEYLYEQLRGLPEKLDQIFDTARAIGRSDAGGLTIGLLAGQRLDPEIVRRLNAFSRKYPELSFTLERAGFSSLRMALNARRYDIIVTLGFDLQDDPDIVSKRIGRQALALFVSRMSPAAALTDLADMPLIAISPKESYGGYDRLLRFCRRRGFSPNIVRLAESMDSLLLYVEAGVGVAVLDRNCRLSADPNIHMLPLASEDLEDEDVVAVWRQSSKNPNIRKMVDCLPGV